MVDKLVNVSVFTDQIKEKKLDPATEKRIRKLLGNSKKITQTQAKILQSIIDDAISSLSKIKTLDQARVFATINIFNTTKSIEKLIPYNDNIGKMFRFGIMFTNKEPSSTVRAMEEAVKQSGMNFITKMGDDLKIQAGDIIANGIKNGLNRDDVVKELEGNLNVTRSRANSIARTETMRAAHAGSYGQAIRDGMGFYIVDSRAEACELCQDEYDGEVFPIDDPSGMPPLHPNCACIPVYFNTEEEAQDWADNISSDNQDIREIIEDKGNTIPKDGTGHESNT